MLRLTLLLSAAMLGALLLLGEDRGQKRPGLAKAEAEAGALVAAAENGSTPVVVVPVPEPLPVPEPAPASVVAVTNEPLAAPIAAAEPAPEPTVEPATDVVQASEEPIFTLSSLGNDGMLGEGGLAPGAVQSKAEIWYVNATSVNVRAEPSTEAEVLGKLAQGEAALIVSATNEEWARIVIEGDGLEGYVALRYLSPEAP